MKKYLPFAVLLTVILVGCSPQTKNQTAIKQAERQSSKSTPKPAKPQITDKDFLLQPDEPLQIDSFQVEPDRDGFLYTLNLTFLSTKLIKKLQHERIYINLNFRDADGLVEKFDGLPESQLIPVSHVQAEISYTYRFKIKLSKRPIIETSRLTHNVQLQIFNAKKVWIANYFDVVGFIRINDQ